MSNTFLNSKYASDFSPANLSGLAVWLSADDSNSVTQSAGVVSSWTDRSPNALNMSQATAGSRPTIESNVQNGRPALRFTTTQMLQSTANLTLAPDQTWFLSFRPLAGTNMIFLEQGPNVNNTAGSMLYGGNSDLFAQYRGTTLRAAFDSIGRGTSPFLVGTWYIASFVNSNLSTIASNDLFWSVNGSARNTTFGVNVSNVLSGNATNLLYINSTSRAPGSNYMGEIIIYNRALPRGEVLLVERYLSDKWAVALPTRHPYATVPSALRLFNPLDISGLSIWLDAADRRKIDVSANLNRVTSWGNKAAPTQDFSMNPTGATFITYTDIDNRGYPALSLPGAQRYSSTRTDLSRAFFFSDTCTCTMFAAWDICGTLTATNAGAFGAFGVTSPTTVRAAVFFTGSTGAGFWQAGTSTGATVNIPAGSIGTPRVQSFRRNGLQMIYRNFGTQTTSNNAGTAPTIQNNQLYRFDLTAQANVGGRVYEILWYNRALSDIEVNSVEVYLAEKWGLRSSLTTGVPPRFTRALSPVFTPVLLSNCALWFDAADRASFTFSSGSNISQWNDKSGVGNHLQQATVGSQPTYIGTTSTRYPAVYFADSARQLVTVSNNSVTGSTSRTLFAITYAADNSNTTLMGTGAHTGSTPPSAFGIGQAPVGGGNILYCPYVYTALDITFNVRLTGMQCLYAYYDNSITQLGGGYGFSTFLSKTGTIGTTATPWYLGRLPDNQISVRGYICEFVLFGRMLTLAERYLVEGYLANKWNISLPNNHPYKTTPV